MAQIAVPERLSATNPFLCQLNPLPSAPPAPLCSPFARRCRTALAGTSTILEGLRAFCVFAGFGVLFDFVYQATFFAAWLSLDVRRSTKNRYDCCCCITGEQPAPCCGCDCGPCVPDVPFDEDKGGLMQPFIKKYMAPAVLSKPGKAVILIACAVFLAFGIWGTVELQQDFSSRWFVSDDSFLQDVYQIQVSFLLSAILSSCGPQGRALL